MNRAFQHFFAFAVALLLCLPVWAQTEQIIIKLKPGHRSALQENTSELMQMVRKLPLNQIKRKFPTHTPPNPRTQMLGRPLVDLSLLYTASVVGSGSSVFLLNQLKNRPEIEYAEVAMKDAVPLFNPNDPRADSVAGSQRQILKRILAYQAWNLEKGDTNTVIGILDTGTPVAHEDLATQIKINPGDPPNGIDDDGNGLVDDYRGWDFGSNDNDPTPDATGASPGHGTSVSGLASAATNNGIGVAGTGFNCKLWPVKIWNWNGSFSNFAGYEAIVYAADMGCKIINCSWGSARSGNQYEQDIINYATFNKGALVVAAGGNVAGTYHYLPANYEYVMGVTMTDSLDRISSAASINYKLDMSAPGVTIYGIQTNGNYGWVNGGSSMASPVVAGAAGLVRSKFPQLNGIQAGELLRVNSDSIYQIAGNQNYRDKCGRGRLNMLKALQKEQSISLRPVAIQVRNRKGIQAQRGDTVAILVRFENYLDSIAGFEAIASANSPKLQFLNNSRMYEAMGSFSGRWETIPFYAVVGQNTNPNEAIHIRIQVKVGNQYEDHRWFVEYFNGSFLVLDANEIRMTVTANGRQGFQDVANYVGNGIRYQNSQYCGEAGLMVGKAATQVSNSVYDTTGKDDHFRIENNIRFVGYEGITQHALHHMNDSAAGSRTIGVAIKQSAYELNSDSLQGSVFLNYQITNRNTNTIDSLCVAQYNDWEVENLNFNFARWDSAYKMGYTWGQIPKSRYAAVQVLAGGEPQFYAIEALGNTTNGNINLFDGFSLAEKWKTMSSGIGRSQAGLGPQGNNVVQVTGVKMRNLAPGETRKVAFAYVFADSLPELKRKAQATLRYFNGQNISPSPFSKTTAFCSGDSVADPFEMTNQVSRFKVYADTGLQQPVYAGTSYSALIKTDSVLYVSGTDSLFEGPASPWAWVVAPTPTAQFFINATLPGDSLPVDSILTFTAVDSGSIFMNRWAINGLTLADTTFKISHLFGSTGNITVCLQQTHRQEGCNNLSCRTIKVYQPVGVEKSIKIPAMEVFPNPACTTIRFGSAADLETVEIFDLSGKLVYTKHDAGKQFMLNINNVAPGFYLWKIKSGGQLLHGRFLVQR